MKECGEWWKWESGWRYGIWWWRIEFVGEVDGEMEEVVGGVVKLRV